MEHKKGKIIWQVPVSDGSGTVYLNSQHNILIVIIKRCLNNVETGILISLLEPKSGWKIV